MSEGAPQKVLTLYDCVAIVVGIVIGASIFRLPSIVAGQVGDDGLILLVWVLGGAISLIGALCYAELATAFPSTGGEYHFLTRAFGPRVGFMFTWARMTVVQTGSIAFLAYVFGDYASQLMPLGSYSASIYALLAVIAFTWLNIAGVHQTRAAQKALTSITVLGLVLIIAVGWFCSYVAVCNTSSNRVRRARVLFVRYTWIFSYFRFIDIWGVERSCIRIRLKCAAAHASWCAHCSLASDSSPLSMLP